LASPVQASHGLSPVAVTSEELGAAWDGGSQVPPVSHINGRLLGAPEAGVDMTFDFPR
jgi:fumarylacetoacetate (FAA) hydrolase